jgi:hypothetical protein
MEDPGAHLCRHDGADNGGPWIIDDTLIPVHDQSITAISKNYRQCVNTQIVIDARRRTMITVGAACPAAATTLSWPATLSPNSSTLVLEQSRATADTATSPLSPGPRRQDHPRRSLQPDTPTDPCPR